MKGTLMLSTGTRGRYALCVEGAEHGDLTAGQPLELRLGAQRVRGRIQYNHDAIYALLGPQTLDEEAPLQDTPPGIGGYYFEAAGGGIAGLCVGMEVRLL